MDDPTTSARTRFKNKLQTYLDLVETAGEDAAFEAALEGYPERQKAQIGALIDDADLAAGLTKAVPMLAAMGIEMDIVDVSNDGVDAALEILKTCPCLEASEACGLPEPTSSLCRLDVEASRRAFPGMNVSALSRRVDEGACVCVFKYERAA